jgi:hypothetical protein
VPATEDFYSAGKLSPEQLQALREMTPEERKKLRAEGHRKTVFDQRKARSAAQAAAPPAGQSHESGQPQTSLVKRGR